MVYILFTISKESRKNFYPRRDLNPGRQPQSKSDDLDRSAIGPAYIFIIAHVDYMLKTHVLHINKLLK